MAIAINHGSLWQDCLSYISHRLKKQSFATWLKHTNAVSDGNGGISIVVPNQFVAEWIEEHYSELIDEALLQSSGQAMSFNFQIGQAKIDQTEIDFPLQPLSATSPTVTSPTAPPIATKTVNPPVSVQPGMLNSRYTYDNLVVGNFNRFSFAASKAVAEAPGKTKYNPLYIYGGVGLGKTHILQAIGHYIINNDPSKKVIYATSEKFTSDFINSISSNRTSDFTNMYRSVDALLIDDAQFFAGKESTQEQFFHTFNVLYNAGKQIILSSDRAPRDIKGMEERLLSRFSWGLVTDIQPPDLETRMAILQRKVELENISISEDVIAYIANAVTSNIRELEGSLIRLLAFASLQGVELNLEVAQSVLSDTLAVSRRTISVDVIKRKVSDNFRVDLSLLSAKKKTQDIVQARQVAMYLARSLTSMSLKAIGESFGGRDHSTVIHACNLIERQITTDINLRGEIEKLSRGLVG